MAGDSAASEWHTEILGNLKNFQESSVKSIAGEISKHQRVFLVVVETLGPYLTNVDPAVRCDASRIIVTLLECLTPSALNRAEVETLTRFLCDLFHGHQSLHGFAARGLLALVRVDEFPGHLAPFILNSMANDVFVPTMPKADRHHVYEMVDVMVRRFEADLQVMEANLLMRFIAFMDGEHEPRNLTVCFRVMAKILQKFDIGPLGETAFDVVACYFPVDFTPTTQEDSTSKLKEALTVGLRRCLTATPLFTQFTIPLILEKLLSDSTEAKEESMRTLVALCELEQGKDVVVEHLPVLWPALRREVLASSTESIEEAALEALTALTALLARGPQQGFSGVEKFMLTVLTDMEPFLRKPDLQLQYPAGKILRAVSLGSAAACGRIADIVLPLGVKLFMEQVQSESRLAIMNVMSLQLKTMAETSSSNAFDIPEKASIAAFYQSLITESSPDMITCMGISGLGHMLKITKDEPFLTNDRIDQICDTLMHGIMSCENSGVVDEIVHFFTIVGEEADVHYIYEKLLPKLFEYLKNREVVPIPIRLVDTVTAILGTSRPGRSPNFINGLLERIQYLDENGPYVPTMKMYLDIIAVYVEGIASAPEAEALYDLVLLPTFGKAIHAATSENVSGYQDVPVLHSLCRIYRSIVARLQPISFGSLVAKLDQMYLRGDTTYKAYTGRGDHLFASAFKPLEKPYITTHTRCISLMTSIACSAPRGYIYTHEDWRAEIQKLLETCCYCADEQSSVFAAQCIGGLLNRIEDDVALDAFISDLIVDPSLSKVRSQERRYIRAVVWITKGVALSSRRDDLTEKFTEVIIQHLSSKKSGEEAADGIRVILEDSSFVLNRQMNANINPLYRQKFFSVVLPILLNSFQKLENPDDAAVKRNHLVAVSHLLKYVPQNVARPCMPQVVPFLLQSLNSTNTDLLLSTLNSFEELLLDPDSDSVSGTLGTPSIPPLIERLLDLCRTPANMNVRMSALKCLGYVSSQLPVAPLQPYKQKVLRTLAKCVDDKKRRVREVAVDTRGLWFLLGSGNRGA